MSKSKKFTFWGLKKLNGYLGIYLIHFFGLKIEYRFIVFLESVKQVT